MKAAEKRSLKDIREEIDAIDAKLHTLLIQRGTVIDELIAIKKNSESGSAFRPAREASMMRSLVERHKGILPLDTIESIWRVIISTFTYVQSPYNVHMDQNAGLSTMRDVARFHFGFTVPLHMHEGPSKVIEVVSASQNDLGLVHAGTKNTDAWWGDLCSPEAPKIIARLPFVERENHPAGQPVFVISHPVGDASARDVSLFALDHSEDGLSVDDTKTLLESKGIKLIDAFADVVGVRLLVSVQGMVETSDFSETVATVLPDFQSAAFIGSHAAPYHYEERVIPVIRP
jgi:chorismate mutase